MKTWADMDGRGRRRTWAAGSADSRWRLTADMFSDMSDDSSQPEFIGYPGM
jgi:hypothetical protein